MKYAYFNSKGGLVKGQSNKNQVVRAKEINDLLAESILLKASLL